MRKTRRICENSVNILDTIIELARRRKPKNMKINSSMYQNKVKEEFDKRSKFTRSEKYVRHIFL